MAFTGEDLIEEAIKFAGGEQATADDVLNARRSLHLLLQEWTAQFGSSFRVGRLWVPVLPAEPGILLDPDVDDVIDITVSTVEAPTASDTYTAITNRLSPSEYAQISTKLDDGVPSSWYLERSEPPRLYLHPTGAGLGATVWFHRLPDPFDPDRNDIGAPQRWYRALMLGTARDVAAKRPWPDDPELMRAQEARIARLEGWSAQAYSIARPADRHRSPFRVRI